MLLLINTDQIFKNENYRGGWIHDKARRRRSERREPPATENVALSLQRLIERPKRVGGRECAGVQGLSGSPSRRKPEGEAVGWDAAFS